MKNKFYVSVLVAVLFSCSPKVVQPVAPAAESKPEPVVATETLPEQAVVSGPMMPPSPEEGKTVYVRDCGNCHKLYEPKSFTFEQWKPIVDHMSKKARLTDSEKEAVLAYLDSETD